MQSQAVYAAARLGLADALAAGPLPAAELAVAVGAKEGHLRRLLRLLVLLGIFTEPESGVYANSPVSELLRRDHPHTHLDLVLHLGDESYWGWAKLHDSMLPGAPDTAFSVASDGLSFWEWLEREENQAVEERFNRAMTNHSRLVVPVALKEYDWAQHAGATVADIGGGEGFFLSSLLRQHPGMRGILFDRPQAMEESRAVWRSQHSDLMDRVELVNGDFFQLAPAADVYFLKFILHDWSDEDSVKILRTLRQAAPPGAHLVLCEAALPDGQAWGVDKACMDLQMMALAGGKERTVGEWRALLAAGGFCLDSVTPLSAGMSILVGRAE